MVPARLSTRLQCSERERPPPRRSAGIARLVPDRLVEGVVREHRPDILFLRPGGRGDRRFGTLGECEVQEECHAGMQGIPPLASCFRPSPAPVCSVRTSTHRVATAALGSVPTCRNRRRPGGLASAIRARGPDSTNSSRARTGALDPGLRLSSRSSARARPRLPPSQSAPSPRPHASGRIGETSPESGPPETPP